MGKKSFTPIIIYIIGIGGDLNGVRAGGGNCVGLRKRTIIVHHQAGVAVFRVLIIRVVHCVEHHNLINTITVKIGGGAHFCLVDDPGVAGGNWIGGIVGL